MTEMLSEPLSSREVTALLQKEWSELKSSERQLAKLIYELSLTGWPVMLESAGQLLAIGCMGELVTRALKAGVSFTFGSSSAPLSSYSSAERVSLIETLKGLLFDLELSYLSEPPTLSERLWLAATLWLLERSEATQNEGLAHALAALSSDLTEHLSLSPHTFYKACGERLAQRLRRCEVAQGGSLEVSAYHELAQGGPFEVLKGLNTLSITGTGALTALLERAQLEYAQQGERCEVNLSISEGLTIGDRLLSALAQSPLLMDVSEALSAHPPHRSLTLEELQEVIGHELSATLSEASLKALHLIAERVELLTLTPLHPMVECPAGSFFMGSEGRGYKWEHPRHQVSFSEPFFIGRHPVTQALWSAVMEGAQPSRFEGEALPVESVSWYEAVSFCNRLSELEGRSLAYLIEGAQAPVVTVNMTATGYRLPTEAEWEYAAKAGTELKYAGSDQVDQVAVHSARPGKTAPVGSKSPNAWGLYDMSGNVWEWCFDAWGEHTYQERAFNEARCLNPYRDEVGAKKRVVRGGGCRAGAVSCYVANRSSADPTLCERDVGVRLVRRKLFCS